MIKHKVLICGICKDIEESRLHSSINIVEKIGSMFEDYRVVMYENNSTNNTPAVLLRWTNRNEKVKAKCETIGKLNFVNPDYLKSSGTARARNIVMSMLGVYGDEFDHIIWIDMDFKFEPDYVGFEEIFQRDGWDAVFANGIDKSHGYWDWLAFRDDVEPFGPELIGHFNWYTKKTDLALKKDWYPVYSAFGGCGVYKRSATKNCKYGAEVSANMEIVYKSIMERKLLEGHKSANLYKSNLEKLHITDLRPPYSQQYKNYEFEGFNLPHGAEDPLIWRMNSFTYNYPVTCDHVPFHADMIAHGFNRLFICPSLIFRYGDSWGE